MNCDLPDTAASFRHKRLIRFACLMFFTSLVLVPPMIAADSPASPPVAITVTGTSVTQNIPGKPGLPVSFVLSTDGQKAVVFLSRRDQGNPGVNKRTWLQTLNLATLEWGPAQYIESTANGEPLAYCADGSLLWQAWSNGTGYLYRLSDQNTVVLTQEPTPTMESMGLTAGCDLHAAFFIQTPKHPVGKPSNDPDRIIRRELSSRATSVLLADHVYASLSLDPAGQHLAFGKADGLWVVGTDGSQPRKIASKKPVINEFAMPAAWSPDGSLVAYRIVWGVAESSIFFAAVDGSAPPARLDLKGVKTIWAVAWHPDGNKLVIAADDQLMVVTLAGPSIDQLVAKLASRGSAPQIAR